eukprot:Plantae.Rhodophyta-Purpureofilum_apyrenoidigerum.ctg8653.p1 GENE.Plantae.Rhodophyta-Purpureofilum_apyrenoidigerum.ctg8653~~Plantae.Rhodophyta-Purpureofilum_apyrenoidigerum.ctg8653.p1  ORF type:complete len:183 (+),score=9.19 Plantae.Rhodophyta-Purpureofilum_apyrenoidigerum.ctg8653:93-641(+)
MGTAAFVSMGCVALRQPHRSCYGRRASVQMGLGTTSVEGVATALRMLVSGDVDVQMLKQSVIAPQTSEVIAAFAGGTVGVMGSLTVFEKRLQEIKERQQCCYCRGAGALPCGHCFTTGCVPTAGADKGKSPCEACSEKGYIVCEHCEGTGRSNPYEYERRTRGHFFFPDDDNYYSDKHNPFL